MIHRVPTVGLAVLGGVNPWLLNALEGAGTCPGVITPAGHTSRTGFSCPGTRLGSALLCSEGAWWGPAGEPGPGLLSDMW